MNDDGRLRAGDAQAADRAHQQALRQQGQDPHRHLSAGEASRRRQLTGRLADLVHRETELAGQLEPGRVGRHVLHLAPAQGHADRLFRFARGPLHCRLRDAEAARCVDGGTALRDRDMAA